MWKKLSIFAIALSLIAPPLVFADKKPGKAPTAHAQPKPTAQKRKAPPPSTNSNGAIAAPSPTSAGSLGAVTPHGYDQPTNTPPR
jgi:hypothetical protein